MNDRVYRAVEMPERVGLSVKTIYRQMAAGKFPKAVRLSPGAVGWTESQIQQWLSDRQAATEEVSA